MHDTLDPLTATLRAAVITAARNAPAPAGRVRLTIAQHRDLCAGTANQPPEVRAALFASVGEPAHVFPSTLADATEVRGTALMICTGFNSDVSHIKRKLIAADGYPIVPTVLNYIDRDQCAMVREAQALRRPESISAALWARDYTPWVMLGPEVWPDFHLTLRAMGGTAYRENVPTLTPAALNVLALVGPNDPLLCVAWAAREHERVMRSDGRSTYQSADTAANELETLLLRAAIDAFNRAGDTLGEARRRHAKRLAEVAAIFDAPVPSSVFPPDGLDEPEVST